MQAKQGALKGDSGGKTRDYLLYMLQQPAISDSLACLAICHLAIYMPLCGAITHVGSVFDMAGIAQRALSTLIEVGERPEMLLERGFALFETYESANVARKLAAVLERAREQGEGTVKQSIIKLLGVAVKSIAGEWHHHTMEWQQAEHVVDATDPSYARQHAQWEKRGGAHLRMPGWQKDRSAEVAATNCVSERVFGLRNHLDNKTNGVLADNHLEGQTLCVYNRTMSYWLDRIQEQPCEERALFAKRVLIALRRFTREREARIGNKRQQMQRNGLIAKEKDDELIAAAAARRAKDEAERAQLTGVTLACTWDELIGLDLPALKLQVRARKKVHGEVGLKLTEASSRFNALRVLVKQLKLGVADEVIRAACQIAKRRARTGGAARRGPQVDKVQLLLGAATEENGDRLYLVRWEGYDEDESTWINYKDMILPGDDGEPVINADLERQLSAFDAVLDDELDVLAERHELTQRALTCELSVGARVIVDRDADGYSAGNVVALSDGCSTEVRLDGAAEAQLFARDNIFALQHAPPFDEARRPSTGARVRVAYDDHDAPLTKRRWFYGVVVALDARAELVSVDFDNGEELRDAPLFDIHFVAHAASRSTAQTARRARR